MSTCPTLRSGVLASDIENNDRNTYQSIPHHYKVMSAEYYIRINNNNGSKVDIIRSHSHRESACE